MLNTPKVWDHILLDVASLSGSPGYDLYAEASWSNGLGVRLGQFKIPLGFEALTEYSQLKLIEYSLVRSYWKPAGNRDVGGMISFSSSAVSFSAVVCNGNGRAGGFQDDNDWKDVAGRVERS